MGEIEDEILEQTKGVAVEAYKDLVRPSAKPLGEILSLFPRTIRLGQPHTTYRKPYTD